MEQSQEIKQKLSQFQKKLEKGLGQMQPQITNMLASIQEATKNMQPILMKDVTIQGHKAKAVMYADNAIRLEFDNKDFAKEFYKTLE